MRSWCSKAPAPSVGKPLPSPIAPAKRRLHDLIPWHNPRFAKGEVAEWLMAADCKSALLRVRWFESSPLHQQENSSAETGSVAVVSNC